MRTMRLAQLAAAAALLAPALPAAAQGLAIHVEGGYHSLAATDSADAIFGETGGSTFGGGIGYRFGNGLFIEAGGRLPFEKSGERVFVASASSPVFKLGFPVDIKITPVFATVGWRFLPGARIHPYFGVGAGRASYEEESTVAGDTRTISESKTEYHGTVGLEVGRGRLRFAAEGVYSSIPDTIGLSGVSKVYGEDDLGGFSVLGRLTFTLSKR